LGWVGGISSVRGGGVWRGGLMNGEAVQCSYGVVGLRPFVSLLVVIRDKLLSGAFAPVDRSQIKKGRTTTSRDISPPWKKEEKEARQAKSKVGKLGLIS